MKKVKVSLIKKAISGDKEAFAKIYAQYSRSVYYLGLRMTKNEHDANDIMQETMLKLYEKLSTIRHAEAIDYFINRTAYNVSINLLKKKKREIFVDAEEQEELLEELDEDFIPEEFLESKEARQQVIHAIDNLGDDQRAVITMFYYEELNVQDIASILDVNEQVVKSRLFRARKKMKDFIQNTHIKEALAVTMATTTLTKLLSMDAKAAYSPESNLKNWEIIAEKIGYNAAEISASSQTALSDAVENAAFKSTALTTGSTVASTGKIIGAVLTAAAAIGSAGLIINSVNSNTSPNDIEQQIQTSPPYISYEENQQYNDSFPQEELIAESESQTVDLENIEETTPTIIDGTEIAEESTDTDVTTALSFEKYFEINKGVLYYTKTKKSPTIEQVLQDSGITFYESYGISDIKVDFFEDVDFEKPGDYVIHVYIKGRGGKRLYQNAIVIVVQPEKINTEDNDE